MKILDDKQIRQKIQRLAIQILENNLHEPELILVGINNNGLEMANWVMQSLIDRTSAAITVTRISLNPAAPLDKAVQIEMPVSELSGKSIIIFDDVANTGRTIFYALKPFMDILPKKVEVAVLVDRKHKGFPIQPDYVGLSLATTLMENIEVKMRDVTEMAVYLN